MSKTETTENITQDESDRRGYMGCGGIKQDIKDTTQKGLQALTKVKGGADLVCFYIMVPVKAVKTDGIVTSGLQKIGQSRYLLTGAHCFKPSSSHI